MLLALLTGAIGTGAALMVVNRLVTDQAPVPLVLLVALTRQKYTVALARLETTWEIAAMLLWL